MTLLARRFLGDYARNPANLLVLVVVPVVFVMVAADTLSDAARLLGGAGGGSGIATVTAGWTSAFLAAIAMYFQVAAARTTDRRLVLSGLPRPELVAARMVVGAVLAGLASAAALLALAGSTGIDAPWRVAAGTLMFAVIYLAFGAIVGATVRNPVNGTVLLLFIWIVDVFFGPTLSASESLLARILPTHFVSLWTVDLPPGHGGPSELAWSLLWTASAVVLAFAVVARTSRVARPRPSHPQRRSALAQLGAGLRMAGREWRRTTVLWVLLVAVPAVFIWLSDLITPHGSTPVTLVEEGRSFVAMLDPAHMHAGTMAPMAVGSLASLVGLFVAIDARTTDQRLVLAGQRIWVVLATRLGVVGLAAGLATVASTLVTATVFTPHQWIPYVAALGLVALIYGLVGVVIGPVFGRVGGTFMCFLIPFLDLGIGQSPMLQGEPASWARFLPGYGSVRVLIDGGLTSTFDESAALLVSLGWVALLGCLAALLFRRSASVAGPLRSPGHGTPTAS